jgi:uncharacterized protein (DUF433 family)
MKQETCAMPGKKAARAANFEVQPENGERQYPRIGSIPGVCGGKPCIRGTRLPVWVLYQAKLAGTSDAELLESYPFITTKDLKDAWRYVEDHMLEVKKTIDDNNMW